MSKNCGIMQRIKANYESRSKAYLTRRTPVIMRIDGKAFHTYTKGLDKPFDEGLIEDMVETTKYLCENIQGAKIGYCQSDEISILLVDYDNLDTQAWFDYSVQKMVSISASLAAAKFNQLRLQRQLNETASKVRDVHSRLKTDLELEVRIDNISETQKLAAFDSRVFNIPVDEVPNYFLARQKDAVKNSISMLAQSLYPHSELHKKNQSDLQEMCFQKGHNWNDLHWSKKRGSTIVKTFYTVGDVPSEDYIPTTRSKWECVETPLKFDFDFFKPLTTF